MYNNHRYTFLCIYGYFCFGDDSYEASFATRHFVGRRALFGV